MRDLLLIAIGGALGALLRYGATIGSRHVFGAGFPYGTLLVNAIGCFSIGCVAHLSLRDDLIPEWIRPGIAVGFLGALTTFSTFGFDTITHFEKGQTLLAAVNVVSNLILGLAAVCAGLWVARAAWPIS